MGSHCVVQASPKLLLSLPPPSKYLYCRQMLRRQVCDVVSWPCKRFLNVVVLYPYSPWAVQVLLFGTIPLTASFKASFSSVKPSMLFQGFYNSLKPLKPFFWKGNNLSLLSLQFLLQVLSLLSKPQPPYCIFQLLRYLPSSPPTAISHFSPSL